MGKNKKNSSSKNKNVKPQTAKAMNATPGKANEEFSSEFTEIITNTLKKLGKSPKKQNKNKK